MQLRKANIKYDVRPSQHHKSKSSGAIEQKKHSKGNHNYAAGINQGIQPTKQMPSDTCFLDFSLNGYSS